MAGLQGSGPLISVELEVLNPNSDYANTPSYSDPSSSSASSAFDQLGESPILTGLIKLHAYTCAELRARRDT